VFTAQKPDEKQPSCSSKGCHEEEIKKHLPHSNSDKLCKSCHQSNGKEHPSSAVKGFSLIEQTPELCNGCHVQPNKTENRTIRAVKNQVKMKFPHPPVSEGCDGCHSGHQSKYGSLLKEAYPNGNYTEGKTEAFALCFGCHETDLLNKERTSKSTNFRDGRKNLHFVHINKEKGRNCSLCHDIHGSNKEHLVVDKVQFGKWLMPLNFVKTETGGSCAPGCHKLLSYKSKLDETIKSASLSGKIILGEGIDKKKVPGIFVHIMKKDNTERFNLKVDVELNFKTDDIIPGKYLAWIDSLQLSALHAETNMPSVSFEIKSDSESVNIASVRLLIRSHAEIVKGEELPEIVVPEVSKLMSPQKQEIKVLDPFQEFKRDLSRIFNYRSGYRDFSLSPELKNFMDSLSVYLTSHPNSRLVLEVHTDNSGTIDELQKFSNLYSKKLVDYLRAKGIKSNRILSRGRGSLQPVATNLTPEGRIKNKRIEMKILE